MWSCTDLQCKVISFFCWLIGRKCMGCIQARNQLGTPGGAKSFLRGAKCFKLCPIVSNCVEHNFRRGGEIFCWRRFPPLVTGLAVVQNAR